MAAASSSRLGLSILIPTNTTDEKKFEGIEVMSGASACVLHPPVACEDKTAEENAQIANNPNLVMKIADRYQTSYEAFLGKFITSVLDPDQNWFIALDGTTCIPPSVIPRCPSTAQVMQSPPQDRAAYLSSYAGVELYKLMMQREFVLTPAQLAHWTIHLLDAVSVLSGANIVHADLSNTNIMFNPRLSADQLPRIIDFDKSVSLFARDIRFEFFNPLNSPLETLALSPSAASSEQYAQSLAQFVRHYPYQTQLRRIADLADQYQKLARTQRGRIQLYELLRAYPDRLDVYSLSRPLSELAYKVFVPKNLYAKFNRGDRLTPAESATINDSIDADYRTLLYKMGKVDIRERFSAAQAIEAARYLYAKYSAAAAQDPVANRNAGVDAAAAMLAQATQLMATSTDPRQQEMSAQPQSADTRGEMTD